MDAFPLVSPQEIGAARARWAEGDPACAALAAEAGAIGPDGITATPDAPPRLRDALHVQTVLFDASLAFALGGDRAHLERVQAVVRALAEHQHPASPVNAAVHTIGLAVAWALCGNTIDGDAVLAVAGDAAPTMAGFARERRAHDHRPQTAVTWAGLGTAALLFDGRDPRAERWRGEALQGLTAWWEHTITQHGVARAGLSGCGAAFRQAAPLLMAARRLDHFDVADPRDNPATGRLALVPGWYALELATRTAAPVDHQAFGGFLPVFSALEPALTGWVHRHAVGADGDGSYGADVELHRSTVFESVLWPPADGDPPLPETIVDLDAGLVLERPHSGRPGLRVSCAAGSQTSFFDEDGTLLLSAGGSPQDGVVRVDGQVVDPQPGRLVGVERTPDVTVATLDLTPRASREDALVRHVVRHIAHVRHPVPYLLIVDDAARVDVTESTFQQILRGPRHAKTSQAGVDHLDATRAAVHSGLSLIALDDDATISVDRAGPLGGRAVWSVSRRARHALMGVLAIPSANGSAATVEGRLDRREGRAVVRWGDGETTQDVLDFHPTTAETATFSRDGERPPADARVLRNGAVNAAPPAAVVAADDRRQRRMRRLVEALDEIAAAKDYPTAPDRGVIMGGASFKFIGREFLTHFVTIGELNPDADVLDVGCGGGRMAAALSYYLQDASYRGFDVHEPSIAWCREHLQARDPRLQFDHVALQNLLYSPETGADAAGYQFPYDDASFDFVIATSLFTHMFRAETAHYLREFARVLRPGAVAFVTAYLLNSDSALAMARDPDAMQFRHEHDEALVRDADSPAAAVAMPQDWLLADARTAGLGVDRVAYGSWTAQTRLALQDVMLLRRDR